MKRSALANRNFLLYSAGSIFAINGLWVLRVSIAWLAWELTESELWVGLTAFCQFFPVTVLGPVFGVVADRVPVRVGVVVANVVFVLIAWLLAAVTAAGAGIGALVGLTTLLGIAIGAYSPFRLSIIPSLVSPAEVQSALAVHAVTFNLSRFSGPAIGGLLIAWSGVPAAFVVTGLLYLVLVATLLVLRFSRPERAAAEQSLLSAFAAGLRYARGEAVITQMLLLMAIFSTFGRGLIEVLPVFAAEVYARGSGALAALLSSAGVGAVISGLFLAGGGLSASRLRRLTGWSVLAAGLSVMALSRTDEFYVGLAVMLILGTSLSACAVGTQAVIIDRAQERFRGRVLSLWGVTSLGAQAVGGLLLGAVSQVTGPEVMALLAGAACLALGATIGRPWRADAA